MICTRVLLNMFWCAVFGLAQLAVFASDLPPPCFSEIYCHGPLLHTVQMNKIYKDSKTFVDMKMKFGPNTTMTNFLNFMASHNNTPERDDVIEFVQENFDRAGSEFEDFIPSDWIENPTFLESIQDEHYRKFAYDLNHIWKELGRKMKDEVRQNEENYSIIWVPNPVIVPGGRFREFYYWDSYWIVQGLLLSEMHETVKGMLSNFAYIVDKYGHIPNGGRVYYLERSQPPLFIPMAKLYLDYTQDFDFIKEHIATYDREFSYWISNHSRLVEFDGNQYHLLAYGDRSRGPRPESYSEDVESARPFKTEEQKDAFYSELKAAAESGWDFSSRWFINNATNNGNLTHLKTRQIIPVDLNAIFHWNAVILAEWHEKLQNARQAQYYREVADKLQEAIETVLWHEEAGVWLDYDISNGVKRDYFYASNLVPLWTGSYDKSNSKKIDLVLQYIENKKILYPGGIPKSLEHTGEQWDFPNGWPPLQHMLIVGLHNTGNAKAQETALKWAETWIHSNYIGFVKLEAMFEKYDVTRIGEHGGGGEYEVQLGFGWTNGVVMDLLHRYGDVLRHKSAVEKLQGSEFHRDERNAGNRVGQVMTGIVAVFVTLAAGYLGVSIYRRRSGHHPIKETKSRPSRAKYTELRSGAARNAR